VEDRKKFLEERRKYYSNNEQEFRANESQYREVIKKSMEKEDTTA